MTVLCKLDILFDSLEDVQFVKNIVIRSKVHVLCFQCICNPKKRRWCAKDSTFSHFFPGALYDIFIKSKQWYSFYCVSASRCSLSLRWDCKWHVKTVHCWSGIVILLVLQNSAIARANHMHIFSSICGDIYFTFQSSIIFCISICNVAYFLQILFIPCNFGT